MTISIIVPCFNHGRWIEGCLNSIVSQGIANLELIVVDGGSTDGTIDVLKRYSQYLAYWVSEPDRGQTDALIKGFARSTGDIMAWINSDDFYEAGALEAIVSAFKAMPSVDVLYGDMRWIDLEGRQIGLKREIPFDVNIMLWDHNYVPQPSTFWRRSLWLRTSGLDARMQCAMDFDLWLKFSRAGATFVHLPIVLSNMRRYSEQKNVRLRAISDEEDKALREQHLGRKVGRREAATKRLLYKAIRICRKMGIGAYWRA